MLGKSAKAIVCDARSVREMISTGQLKATEIGNGIQRKNYKINRTDIEAVGTMGEEKVTKPKRRRGGN